MRNKRFLFICNYAQSRSRWFAEQFMRQGYMALFCGINELADFRISKYYLDWCDAIIVLEEHTEKTLHEDALDYYVSHCEKIRINFYIDDDPPKFMGQFIELKKILERKGLWE